MIDYHEKPTAHRGQRPGGHCATKSVTRTQHVSIARLSVLLFIGSCIPDVSATYTCDNGTRTLDFKTRCDFLADCLDKTDEKSCYYDVCSQQDKSKVFYCDNKSDCVLSAYVCDGENDCSDGSDENKCLSSCPGTAFMCANRRDCLPKSFVCDGHKDCDDNSDERNCSDSHIGVGVDACRGEFQCGDGTCLKDSNFVCNGKNDCASGADEQPQLCHSAQGCERCPHMCVHHARGMSCGCYEGYRFSNDGSRCDDIDECSEPLGAACSQLCTNTPGSFNCSCLPGYTLFDGRHCKSSIDPMFLWYRSHNDSASEVMLQSGDNMRKITLPALVSDERMFWIHKPPISYDVDREDLYIRRGEVLYRLKTREAQLPSERALPIHIHVKDFAVDFVTQNIYFTNARNQKSIMVCAPEEECVPVVSGRPNAVSLLTIAHLPLQGSKLFWKELPHVIVSSNLDGSDVKQVFKGEPRATTGLQSFTVHAPSGKLYVLNQFLIEVDLSTGKTRKLNEFDIPSASQVFWNFNILDDQLLVQMLQVPNVAALIDSVADFRVYTYDRLTGKHTGMLKKIHNQQLHSVHYRSVLAQGPNPCWSSPCSHVCVALTDRNAVMAQSVPRRVCLCPPGMTLDDDERKCTPDSSIEELFYVNGSTFSSYVYTQHALYRLAKVDLHAVPIAIESNDEGTLFFATRRGLFSQAKNGTRKELGIHLKSVQSLAFDRVDKALYAVQGMDLLVINANGNVSLVKQGVDIEHLDIDPQNRTLYIESSEHKLFAMQIGEWKLVSFEVSLSSDTPLGGQRKWTFDPFERMIRTDASVVLRDGYCDLIHLSEKGFDCEMHAKWLERCDEAEHRNGLLCRSSGRSLDNYSVSSACSGDTGCDVCVTDANGIAQCICSYGHTIAADGKTCSKDCGPGLLRCPSSNACIRKSARCDGYEDCAGGVDEVDCHLHDCGEGSFQCTTNGVCISASFKCDGQSDCADGSDEAGCPARNCTGPHKFLCEDGVCIPDVKRCDGKEDCFHGDDEKNCTTQSCPPKHFRCPDDIKCLPDEFKCDGTFDCKDHSDEKDCKMISKTIEDVQKAIFGTIDSTKCDPEKYFCCGSGEKLSLNLRCNYDLDCDDHSDEANCDLQACDAPLFKCSNGTCLFQDEVCDGIPHCSDGADENECYGRCHEKPNLFLCAQSGRCISKALVCNNKPDCEDGSDENAYLCPPIVKNHTKACFADEFKCGKGGCIPVEQLCDGKSQCEDGSDEQDHCGLHECQRNNGGCAQLCHATPDGVRCGCNPGYRIMSNGFSCEDIDECEEDPAACSQICHNTKGNFTCECADGFTMSQTGVCKAGHGKPILLAAVHGAVEAVVGSDKRALFITSQSTISGLAYDFAGGFVFVSEYEADKVHRISLERSGTDDDHQTFTRLRPGPLAVDWITENVYFADASPFIHACSRLMAGIYCTNVTETIIPPYHNGEVASIALVPDQGIMFYSYRYFHAIVKMQMDGSEKHELKIKEDAMYDTVRQPTCLTVDPVHKRLYWLDVNRGSIECTDFNGEKHIRVLKNLDYVSSFALFEDFIWFAKHDHSVLVSAHKLTGAIKTSHHNALGQASLIQVMHPVYQPRNGVNHCANTPCKHMCLLRSEGYTCACSAGYQLSTADNSTCEPMVHTSDEGSPEDEFEAHMANQCSCLNGGLCKSMRNSVGPSSLPIPLSSESGKPLASNSPLMPQYYCSCPPGFRGVKCELGPSSGVLFSVIIICIVCCVIGVAGILFILMRAQSLHQSGKDSGRMSHFDPRDNESLLHAQDDENNEG